MVHILVEPTTTQFVGAASSILGHHAQFDTRSFAKHTLCAFVCVRCVGVHVAIILTPPQDGTARRHRKQRP
jgi:hypothetical protein